MKKFLIVLFVAAMGLTIYYNEKKKYVKTKDVYTIAYIYGDRNDFIKRSKKISEQVTVNKEGGVDLTLNTHQRKAWEKSMKATMTSASYMIEKDHPQNDVKISENYDRIDLRMSSDSIAGVRLYLPRLLFACEISQVLERLPEQTAVHIYNTDTHKSRQYVYPESGFADFTSDFFDV